MAVNPINPTERIPNNPFYWPQESAFQTPQGPLIFGNGLKVDYNTGVVSVDPAPPASLGTVTLVTAGVGLVSDPPSGITSTGKLGLDVVVGLTPGTYTYPAIAVDAYGRVTSISNGPTPLQSVTGLYPLSVTGSAPSLTISIAAASTTNSGAVQLVDNTSTPSVTLALTANQGNILQTQINALAATANLQFLAGTLNASTTNVITATTQGISKGIIAGSPLPASSSTNIGAIVIVAVGGTYTAPGGTSQVVVPGDQYLSTGTSWVLFQTGFRAPYATTTSAGIVRLATVTEVQALADNTVAVTPFGLSGMVASTTQQGFVRLSTDAETLALGSTTTAVTPSNLSALAASTTQRGIVQLNDTLTSTSVTEAPTARALKEAYDNTIHTDIIQANGDLIVGKAAADPQILPKGGDGQVLTVDNTQPLGLRWKTPTVPQSTPIGAMCWFTTKEASKLPVGWLVADGSSYPVDATNDYYDLYLVIGYTFTPPTDPANTFRVPDLRGQFIRGWNDAGSQGPGTLDIGRGFGSCQGSAYQQHSHAVCDPGHTHGITDPTHTHTITDPGHTHGVTDPGHFHTWDVNVASVVGNNNSLFDGDGKKGSYSANSGTSSAGIAIQNSTTGVTINAACTGILNTLSCTTALSVLNSPPTAPTPNETRPVNLALLPIIKYKEP